MGLSAVNILVACTFWKWTTGSDAGLAHHQVGDGRCKSALKSLTMYGVSDKQALESRFPSVVADC